MADVTKKFEEHEIVPDVIDVAPKKLINIKYSGGENVELGNELTPTQVKDQPTTLTWDAESGSYYTLLFVDPDAPSRQEPKLRNVIHWLVVNISGNNLESGESLSNYVGSGPPKDKGLHRYVFLVFKQNGKISIDDKEAFSSREGRVGASTKDFISKYSLGNPVAGNFYQAQYDDYVLILQAQFAKK